MGLFEEEERELMNGWDYHSYKMRPRETPGPSQNYKDESSMVFKQVNSSPMASVLAR